MTAVVTPHWTWRAAGFWGGVCAAWVARAIEAGKGCSIYLKRTHENTLEIVPLESLKKFAIDLS